MDVQADVDPEASAALLRQRDLATRLEVPEQALVAITTGLVESRPAGTSLLQTRAAGAVSGPGIGVGA
jgi:hypothetical protein